MSALEDRLSRFAYEWHEAMNSPYTVNMMPMLLKAASDVRRLVAPSVEAENARLREVCKKMHEQVKHNCDFCDEYYCSSWDEDNECCVYDTYMREMGIEVTT